MDKYLSVSKIFKKLDKTKYISYFGIEFRMNEMQEW